MTESIKEIRKIVLFVLTLTFLWFLTADAFENALSEQKIVEDLASWAILKDTIQAARNKDSEDTFNVEIGQTIEQITILIPVQSGTEVPRPERLKIDPPWEPGISYSLALKRLPGPERALVFQILTDNPALSKSGYRVAILDNTAEVFHYADTKNLRLRDLYDVIRRDGYGAPKSAGAALNILWRQGWKSQSYKDLKSTDPIFLKLISDIREKKYYISALPVSPQLYPSAFGLVFLFLSYILLGPIIRLGSLDEYAHSDPWIMTVDIAGPMRWPLRAIQAASALVVTLLPVLVIADQYAIIAQTDEIGWTLWQVSAIGGASLSLALLIASVLLFKVKTSKF